MRQPMTEPCRLCHGQADVTRLDGPVWNVSCDPCGLVLFGGEQESRRMIVERWNRLVAQTAAPGPEEAE